ncbi:interferon regulatory factor 9 [Pogona vitticeps]
MATPKRGVRITRKLRDWTIEQVEGGKFPGVVWEDPPAKTMFRIPWKHAGKQEFRHEEDAGFFKEWAVFKGKYRPGDRINPAAWKTRIRCAFSKSPEFEEVPERSRLDITEPYKVYRLVPLSEQVLGPRPKLLKSKKVKLEQLNKNACSDHSPLQPAASLPLLEVEVCLEPAAMTSNTTNGSDPSAYQNGETSPQAGEPAPEVNENSVCFNPVSTLDSGVEAGDYSVQLSVFYSGELVQQSWIPAGEFLISSAPAPSAALISSMSRVGLPLPIKTEGGQKQEAVLLSLKDLEKGVMVASNEEGIFAQCRGKASLFCRGPSGVHAQGRLENNTFLQLFSTRLFKAALEQFQLGLAPLPEHRITLCVGEELGEDESMDSKPIIIQIEPVCALRLLSAAAALPVVEASSCLDPVQVAVLSANILP